MIGNSVTQFQQHTIGTVGYTIIMDCTDLHLNQMEFLMVDANGVTGDPAPAQAEIEVIHDYINDSDCPDIAWNLSSDILTIFLKTSVYAYVITTTFTIYGYRNPTPIKTLDSLIDIKDKDLNWFNNLVIKKAAEMQGKRVPPSVINNLNNIIT